MVSKPGAEAQSEDEVSQKQRDTDVSILKTIAEDLPPSRKAAYLAAAEQLASMPLNGKAVPSVDNDDDTEDPE